jgi:hypothetical protein
VRQTPPRPEPRRFEEAAVSATNPTPPPQGTAKAADAVPPRAKKAEAPRKPAPERHEARAAEVIEDDGLVVPLMAWHPGMALQAACRRQTVTLQLPLVGKVTLPSGPHLAWYAGVMALAAVEVVEWPAALLMAVAKALADSRHHELLREFGDALESGA